MKNLELIEKYQKFKKKVNELFCFLNYVQNIEITEYKGVKYVSISILNLEKEKNDEDFDIKILINLDEKIEGHPFIIYYKRERARVIRLIK